jgi:hypothetical protein
LRDESLSEAAATKRLIETRPKADVLRARAKVVDEQTVLVLELGAVVRRNLARAANEVLVARQIRIRHTLDNLITPPGETRYAV